jgi:hypothetical protein
MIDKKLFVSFLALVSVVFLVATVSAVEVAQGGIIDVEVNGVNINTSNPSLTVGDTVTVRVEFVSDVNASGITVEAEIKVGSEKVTAETRTFDVEQGRTYVKTLSLEVPFDLDDVLSDFATLDVEISGNSGLESAISSTPLRVQRESFNADIKAISVPQTVEAGDLFPVDVVLKNLGYNNLDDVFVTARISALNIERTAFFGDIVALSCDADADDVTNYGVEINGPGDTKCNEDDEDTLNGRLFLQVPYGVKSGVYALEVEVENDDTISSQTIQVVINNAFSAGNFIVSGNQLLIVNPTNDVVVYRIVPDATSGVSVSVSESIVAVPAGSSRTVLVDATTSLAEAQTYSVNIFSADGTLVDTVSFSKVGTGNDTSSPIVVLTIILAIIFIVLLVVLIVLIGKKPEKADEFGESYY